MNLLSLSAAVPHPFTLNDLRAQPHREEPSSTSTPIFSGLVLAVFLATGAFIWLIRCFATSTSCPPARHSSRQQNLRGRLREEIIAPLTPVHATKSIGY